MFPGNTTALKRTAGFTLVEVMVSTVVLAIMLLLISSVISQTQKSWRRASTRLTQFREARLAFDTMTRNLQQATLNAYRDHYYSSTKKNYPASTVDNPKEQEFPSGSRRNSELAFVSGKAADLVVGSGAVATDLPGHAVFFQAPLGVTDPEKSVKQPGTTQPLYQNLKELLCTRAYFMMKGDDAAFLPVGLTSRLAHHVRLRLMEYQPPAEMDQIYASRDVPGATGGINDWMMINPDYLRPLTEHVVGLVISPLLATGTAAVSYSGGTVPPTYIATSYAYDSRVLTNVFNDKVDPQGTQHLLPPIVRVTMVALDNDSLEKLERAGESTDVITTSGAVFGDAGKYQTDIDQVKNYLNEKRLSYRIFESSVIIPAARKAL